MRRDRDRYDTPSQATEALLAACPELRGRALLDPCAGDGRMAARIAQRGPFAVTRTNDLDPSAPTDTHFDARGELLWQEQEPPDWIVTNPPYLHAGLIVQKALDARPNVGVAMLLRLTFGEPCSGRLWLSERPWTFQVVLPRISFTGGGTDSVTVAWFVWLAGAPSRNRCVTREQLRAQNATAYLCAGTT